MYVNLLPLAVGSTITLWVLTLVSVISLPAWIILAPLWGAFAVVVLYGLTVGNLTLRLGKWRWQHRGIKL